MTKLSKREKVLLYIMAIVLIVGGIGYFLIIPSLSARTDLDASIEELSFNCDMMTSAIASTDVLSDNIDKMTAETDDLSSFFPIAMTNDDIDRYVTGIMQKNGLTAESLAISDAGEALCPVVVRKHIEATCSGGLTEFVSFCQEISDTGGARITSFSVLKKEGGIGYSISFGMELSQYDPLLFETYTLYADVTDAGEEDTGGSTEPANSADYLN